MILHNYLNFSFVILHMFVFCLGVKNFWFISAKMDDFQMICRRLIVGLILLGLELTCSTIFWDLSTLSRLFLYFKTYNLGRFNPFTAPRLLLFTFLFLFLIMFLILMFFFFFFAFYFPPFSFFLFLFLSLCLSFSFSLSFYFSFSYFLFLSFFFSVYPDF